MVSPGKTVTARVKAPAIGDREGGAALAKGSATDGGS